MDSVYSPTFDPEDDSLRFAQGGISLEEHENADDLYEKSDEQLLKEQPGHWGDFHRLWFNIRDAVESVCYSDLMRMATLSDGDAGYIVVSVPEQDTGNVRDAIAHIVRSADIPVQVQAIR